MIGSELSVIDSNIVKDMAEITLKCFSPILDFLSYFHKEVKYLLQLFLNEILHNGSFLYYILPNYMYLADHSIEQVDVLLYTCNIVPLGFTELPAFKYAKATFMDPLKRGDICLETNHKTGIYCWVNKINGNAYIGSAHSLYKRISNYYQASYYKRESNLVIIRAIKKHGLENFALVILEYTDIETLIEREKYWIDKIEPAYNMIKNPTIIFSSAKHRQKIDRTGSNNSFYGKKHTPENRAKMREVALKRTRSHSPCVTVEITDNLTGTTTEYSSMTKAAQALGQSHHGNLATRKKRNTQNLYKGRYLIKFTDPVDKGSK